MAGIYIHIPFCRQACHYCNFHFSVSLRQKEAFLECLLQEADMQKGFFGDPVQGKGKTVLDSIYLGGGTPSILEAEQLAGIFDRISRYFAFDDSCEITLEANPDDLSRDKLSALKQSPVNRLSIGIQSFHAPDLAYMNRIHSPAQALESVAFARKAGFENLTVDLIYGTPTMRDPQWRENLRTVFELDLPHVSAYALTVENRTALEVMIRKGQAVAVDEEQTARQFEIMLELMAGQGYDHYEISNFARPGQYSRHNLSYWTGQPYLGLGPSAHSYKNGQRWWNLSNTSRYIASVRQGILSAETEVLTAAQRFDEYVMTSLRTMWGLSLRHVEENWGVQRMEWLQAGAREHIRRGLLMKQGSQLLLTDKGKLFADRIASDLFWID
ncbi:MAG: radical SAM family heme chaperone HemW [Bacteroidales bacterium]